MSGSDQQDLAFKGQQFPFSLSGRSEVLGGKVEEGESQHTEEILTFYGGRGMLGRGRCGEKRWERAGCWEQPAGASGQSSALLQSSVCMLGGGGGAGAPEHPQPGPCPVATQLRNTVTSVQLFLSAVPRVWV